MAIVVAGSRRRRGIGRLLLEAVDREAARRHCGDIVLGTGVQRFDAHAFYSRMGYERDGVRFKMRLSSTAD